MTYSYCSYEGNPTLVSDTDAWWYVGVEWKHMTAAEWKRINGAEAGGNAAIIGEKAFKERFGQLPPLPATAFQDDGNP